MTAYLRTTSSSWAGAVLEAMRLEGLDVAQLCADVGLDRSLLREPESRFAQDMMTRLWHLAVKRSGNPALGLNLAQVVRPAYFNLVGYAMMSSPSLLEAFKRIVRFQRIMGESADLDLRLEPQKVVLVLAFHGDELPVPSQVHDAAMAYLMGFCRWMTGRELVPQQARFAAPAPVDPAPYAALFGCPLAFASSEYALVFDRAEVNKQLSTGNDRLAQMHDHMASEYLAQFAQNRVTHQARQTLCRLLPQGEPKRDVVAEAMRVSTRTLQRRLQEEGTSFQQLLDDTRRELALQYLAEPELTLLEIAYLLGFADPSNFFRAFRRWYAVPPGQYREQHLNSPAANFKEA